MKNEIDQQEPAKQTAPETLVPPKNNPLGTVASRRNPCYGFAVVSYIEKNFPDLNLLLMATRDEIIKIVDPDRTPENCPRKLPGLIKTKSLHASFYGSAPYLRQDDYSTFFQSKEDGLDNGVFLQSIKEKLTSYLSNLAPLLIPVGLEFKEDDGTILARLRVETNDHDERPLASLKTLLDSGRANSAPVWDPNPLRDTTVAIVLCVAAVRDEPGKIEQIKAVLNDANVSFRTLGAQSMTNCSIIKEFDKRTLTRGKHVEIFAEVDKDQNLMALTVPSYGSCNDGSL
ncbi:MAG: hypothetical protein Q8R24_04920 [Legionellaceae bacterium]|nr:hypothetical protein [Legionellaceae bacterium]